MAGKIMFGRQVQGSRYVSSKLRRYVVNRLKGRDL